MTRLLLSTFLLLIISTALSACRKPKPKPKPVTLPYFELYDRAVAFYFKPPQNPEKAINLLQSACDRLPEKQDLSCYNLGLLQELRGNTGAAVQAYRKAYKLKPHPVYRAAVYSLISAPELYKSSYSKKMQPIITACRQKKPARALRLIKTLGAYARKDPLLKSMDRQIFNQPFFQDCLKGEKDLKKVLALFPSGKSKPLDKQYYRYMARAHSFHSLWDMELYLQKTLNQKSSKHPVTRAWQKVLLGARKGAARQTAQELKSFMKYISRTKSTRQKRLALRRAAALVIQHDRYFRRVRRDANIQVIIKPYLK